MALRIVLTGGPASGKTVTVQALSAERPDRFIAVPEAATQVYAAANTRWDLQDAEGQRVLQRRMYHLQRAQEERLAREYPGRILLLDRGTVDGSVYWPDGTDAYWQDLGTTRVAEVRRYDAVIWMETAAAIGIYDGSLSNPCRFEDAAGAVVNGEKLLHAWSGIHRLVKIPAFQRIAEKTAAVRQAIAEIEAEHFPRLPER